MITKDESPQLFNAIARRYDPLNRILSFGLDILWRRRMVHFLPGGHDLQVLDMACGTGDVAIDLAKGCNQITSVIGIDPAEEMLKIGRRKIQLAGLEAKIALLAGDAQKLKLPDNNFHAVTVAFGLRNMPRLMDAITEAYRVLKPEGHFIILEFSQPSLPVIRQVHGVYLRYVMPIIGGLIAGKLSAYRYLSTTIMGFPSGERFARIIRQAGFQSVIRQELCHGTATIYVAKK